MPNAEPSKEIMSKAFRPNESENRVVQNVPTSCKTANEIDETDGSIDVAPTFSKIKAAYVIMIKKPEKCARHPIAIPFKIPLRAARLTTKNNQKNIKK